MPTAMDPIEPLKRQAASILAEEVRGWNSDDIAARLGTDRSRIADLRNQRLTRFSLETLLRYLVRAGMRVELRVARATLRDRGAKMTVERE